MAKCSLFYITAESMEEAQRIAQVLVEEQLAACVNVIPRLVSFFFWEGEVQSEEEVLVLGKTKSDLIDELTNRVKEVHSYDLPCVISWDIDAGNQAFLDWITMETK